MLDKTPQELKTDIPMLLPGVVGPNRDMERDCYCVPLWWHGGCNNVFYDPAYEEISVMFADELNYIARQFLGYTGMGMVDKDNDEASMKLWALTFRTVLPHICILEAHIAAKGYIIQYSFARHISLSETNRLLVLADCLLMAKMFGMTWAEVLENDYVSTHSVIPEGMLTTQFVQFVHSTREVMENPDGEYDVDRLSEIHKRAAEVFHKLATLEKSTPSSGEVAEFFKGKVSQSLIDLRTSMGEDLWKSLEEDLGQKFDDLLDDLPPEE